MNSLQVAILFILLTLVLANGCATQSQPNFAGGALGRPSHLQSPKLEITTFCASSEILRPGAPTTITASYYINGLPGTEVPVREITTVTPPSREPYLVDDVSFMRGNGKWRTEFTMDIAANPESLGAYTLEKHIYFGNTTHIAQMKILITSP